MDLALIGFGLGVGILVGMTGIEAGVGASRPEPSVLNP